jgi:hypothetical protein
VLVFECGAVCVAMLPVRQRRRRGMRMSAAMACLVVYSAAVTLSTVAASGSDAAGEISLPMTATGGGSDDNGGGDDVADRSSVRGIGGGLVPRNYDDSGSAAALELNHSHASASDSADSSEGLDSSRHSYDGDFWFDVDTTLDFGSTDVGNVSVRHMHVTNLSPNLTLVVSALCFPTYAQLNGWGFGGVNWKPQIDSLDPLFRRVGLGSPFYIAGPTQLAAPPGEGPADLKNGSDGFWGTTAYLPPFEGMRTLQQMVVVVAPNMSGTVALHFAPAHTPGSQQSDLVRFEAHFREPGWDWYGWKLMWHDVPPTQPSWAWGVLLTGAATPSTFGLHGLSAADAQVSSVHLTVGARYQATLPLRNTLRTDLVIYSVSQQGTPFAQPPSWWLSHHLRAYDVRFMLQLFFSVAAESGSVRRGDDATWILAPDASVDISVSFECKTYSTCRCRCL